MEKVVRKFAGFAQSDRADRAYYRSLTPEQRLDILLDLIASYRDMHNEAAEGFKRVYRVLKLGKR